MTSEHIMVAGGAGYIVSHAILGLLDSGHKVVTIDDLSTSVAWAVDPRCDLIVANVSDQDTVRSVIREDTPQHPINPYAASKLMTEQMLKDAAGAHAINFAILRYFNVAGADPQGRAGQSSVGATHLIKVAIDTALGRRHGIDIFGTDYPTPDGTGIRDH